MHNIINLIGTLYGAIFVGCLVVAALAGITEGWRRR